MNKIHIPKIPCHKKRLIRIKSTKEGLDAKPTKRLSDINSVSGIPALGDMIKGK